MRARHRAGAALAALAAAISSAAPAGAAWPAARHDPQRTGASTRTSNLEKPAQYWRSYLGGALGPFTFLLGDTNTDGDLDVLYVAGGRLILARPEGEVLWQTPNLGFVGIPDVVDLDGDGGLDVVVVSASRASVVDGRTGAIAWRQDPDEMGTLTAVRLADFDADGHVDLFLDACGACCAVDFDNPGVVYTFPGGFGAPQVLGTPPPRDHCNSAADTVGDWDGDGVPDLLVPASETMLLVRGTGEVLGESGPLGIFIGGARCEAAAIDAEPGDEVVCLHNAILGAQGGRRVFALTYRPGATPPVELLWEATLAPAEGGDLRAPNGLVWDLDLDGQLEVVASGKQGDTWTAFVLDALTGAELASAPGALASAVTPADVSPPLLLATEGDQALGFQFSRFNSPPIALLWSEPARRVPSMQERARGRRTALATSAALVDLDGDGAREIVLESTDEPTSLHAYRIEPFGLTEVAAYPLELGVGVAALGVPVGVETPARLGVSRNDGYFALLDAGLATLNAGKEGTETLPGMRAGGYYTGGGGLFAFGRAPIAAPLTAEPATESLLVVDARGDLVRIDATGASNVSPAKPTWRAHDTFGASIGLPASGADPRVGCFRRLHPLTEPPTYVLATLDAGGEQVGQRVLAKPPVWDVLPGHFDADGEIDFAAIAADATLATDVIAVTALGDPIWTRSLSASYGTSPIAVADWDQDGRDDVVAAIDTAHVYAGPTGDLLADGGAFLAYFVPLVADVTGDGVPDATLQGGLFPARTLGHDLVTLVWQGPDDRPYPYGALATCPDGPRLVEGSLASPSRLAITPVSGPAAGQRIAVVLAGGSAFPDEAAAEAAGAALGQLGDVAVSPDLGGGDPTPTALVGSTDGHLYAVDACTAGLRWSHAFDAPVGAPILTDTDGDGFDDIVVSVADGYLYGLRHETLPGPERVWDVDPPNGQTGEDIDEIVTRDTLHVVWSAVPEAVSYEVAVVGAAGTYLTTPAWVDVGNVTLTSIGALPLNDGAKYYVGVRAVSPQGRSPDRPSDGVIVHLGEDGGTGGGGGGGGTGGAPPEEILLWGRACTCGVAGGAPAPWAGLGVGALAVAARIVRRRTRRPPARVYDTPR